jgi:hypothetical protein
MGLRDMIIPNYRVRERGCDAAPSVQEERFIEFLFSIYEDFNYIFCDFGEAIVYTNTE